MQLTLANFCGLAIPKKCHTQTERSEEWIRIDLAELISELVCSSSNSWYLPRTNVACRLTIQVAASDVSVPFQLVLSIIILDLLLF